jgi:hypothetical protein
MNEREVNKQFKDPTLAEVLRNNSDQRSEGRFISSALRFAEIYELRKQHKLERSMAKRNRKGGEHHDSGKI